MSTETIDTTLEEYFAPFRENILGHNDYCTTAYGRHSMIYADWIAEGRLYGPIEDILSNRLGAFVANPHSYSNYTGQNITRAYKYAREIIRNHVNAGPNDVLVTVGHGMTGAQERLIQILSNKFDFESEKPLVFVTHMEHHSNHTTWQQAGADLIVIPPDENGLPSVSKLAELLEVQQHRALKIGSFTACSNVSGIITPYHQLASEMHKAGGYCIVDFAASAPYVDMNMHPENGLESLDAVVFAPHKFLGGPGSCGVLIFNRDLHCGTPSVSGGGNVRWTQPEGSYGVSKDVETQEDGGTPAYLQTIRTALSIRLKEKMGVDKMALRERELLHRAIDRLKDNEKVNLIECNSYDHKKIGTISFNIVGCHYNLAVRLLNDRFGIQTRGGWSCASTYGHYLFKISRSESDALVQRIESGNFTGKPGWVRISLHPTMTTAQLDYCLMAIESICEHARDWGNAYKYDSSDNEYYPVETSNKPPEVPLEELFDL